MIGYDQQLDGGKRGGGMTAWRLIFNSLMHHRWPHAAAAAGATVAAAVLCGALIVGDSMRASLADLARKRLGNVEAALAAPRFVRAELASELERAAATQMPGRKVHVLPGIVADAALETSDRRVARRSVRAKLWAVDDAERIFPDYPPFPVPHGDSIVLNRTAADRLGVGSSDTLILRVPSLGEIPSESLLGRKSEPMQSVRVRVASVIADEAWGRFGLETTQRVRPTAWVSRGALCEWLGLEDRANTLLAVTPGSTDRANLAAELQRHLEPDWVDCGVRIETSPGGVLVVTAAQLVMPPSLDSALRRAFEGRRVQPALTHLANSMACNGRSIPYSTITAVDFQNVPPLGPINDVDGRPIPPLQEDQVVLNAWAAEQLKARPGDRITIVYFEQEVEQGRYRERTVELRLAAVAAMSGPAVDRAWTPRVPGITDKLSLGDWDPPFPFEQSRIRPADDDYWKQWGPTPKAFVSLATGRRLWAGRFGETTTLRVAPDAGQAATEREALPGRPRVDPADVGLVFMPVRQQALAAAVGTTPFEWLFLGFSGFVIVAAVLLLATLFRLAIDRRAAELGLLAAVGFDRGRILRVLLSEAAAVASIGSLVGAALGAGYAWLMLWGLRTWWLPAVGTTQLTLCVSAAALFQGWLIGAATALGAMTVAVRRLTRIPPRQLLAGAVGASVVSSSHSSSRFVRWGAGMLAVTAAAGAAVAFLPERMRAALFFGTGIGSWASLLLLLYGVMRQGRAVRLDRHSQFALLRLAMVNAAANPTRSLLSAALLSLAVFLVTAISAFQIDAGQFGISRLSGNGGFALIAQSLRAIDHDLNTEEGRAAVQLVLPEEIARRMRVFSLRVKPGDDASCLNPYRISRPRVLGVPDLLIERGGFAFAQAANRDHPWFALRETAADGSQSPSAAAVPVILDQNTAMYSLHLWEGIGQEFEIDDDGGRIRMKVVGLLENSIFQGELLIAESVFVRLFPRESGYRYFLIESGSSEGRADGLPSAPSIDAIRRYWEASLSDYGVETQTTVERLAELAAVQNTYLSTFRSLGGLGLLLGSVGLAVVQWRTLLERRGELALMLATGFSRLRLAVVVLCETWLLLGAGCAVGLASAAIATVPNAAARASTPWAAIALLAAAMFVIGSAVAGLSAAAVLRHPPWAVLRRELR